MAKVAKSCHPRQRAAFSAAQPDRLCSHLWDEASKGKATSGCNMPNISLRWLSPSEQGPEDPPHAAERSDSKVQRQSRAVTLKLRRERFNILLIQGDNSSDDSSLSLCRRWCCMAFNWYVSFFERAYCGRSLRDFGMAWFELLQGIAHCANHMSWAEVLLLDKSSFGTYCIYATNAKIGV